jgi:hypothetical protein
VLPLQLFVEVALVVDFPDPTSFSNTVVSARDFASAFSKFIESLLVAIADFSAAKSPIG